MISKPTLGDIKYNKMSLEEMSLNYERDLMLWEQTQALNNLTSSSIKYSNNTPIYTPTEYEYKQLAEEIKSDKDSNFKYGSPEYIQNNYLKRQLEAVLNKIDYLEMNVKGFIWFITSVIICLGIPTLFITNIITLKVGIIIAIITLPMIHLYINYLIRKLINKAYNLKDKKSKLVFNANKNQKEIINLQH